MERVQPLTERQPGRTRHQPIDDIAVHAVSGERDRFIACFRGNRDDVPTQDFSLDLQVFARIGIVNRRRDCRNFRNSHIRHGFNLDDESGFIAVIADLDVVGGTVAAEGKRHITLRKGKEKSARNTAVTGANGGGAVPVRVGTENGNLSVCVGLEIVNLTGLHIPFSVHVNARCLVENLDISGRFHNTVEGVTALFQLYATHFKADDEITLFDESVIEVASVHACVTGSADRSGRWVQTEDFGCHVLIGGRGHVDTVAVGIFKDKFEKHSCTPFTFSGLMWYNVYKQCISMCDRNSVQGGNNMIDLKKLESLVGMTETAALIEDSEYSQIKNDDKVGSYPSPHIFDATEKTVKDIITSLRGCQFSGLTTFDEGVMRGYDSDKEMADKVNASKYYIIIRNVDMLSQNPGSWSDLIDIIKSIRFNSIAKFPKSCMVVITKSNISKAIIELDAYCSQCIQ